MLGRGYASSFSLFLLPTADSDVKWRSLSPTNEQLKRDHGEAVHFDSLPTRHSLLSRLRNLDDTDSWHTFFNNYWRLLYNVARKSGLNDDEAQDVVQETVIAVARKMPEFRYDPARGSFKQWLLLITRRRIHDHLRRAYRTLPDSEGVVERNKVAVEEVPAASLPPDAEMDAEWDAEWRANLLQAALARLRQTANPKHYQVFDYCVLQDLGASEVARMLGMNAAQVYLVKHRMSHAVRQTVKAIERELGGRDAST